MAFSVRVFGYRHMKQLHHGNNTQYTGDTVYAIEEPYEWSVKLTCNGAAPATFTAPANDASQMIRIEVPGGQAIRYEISPPGRVTGSPAVPIPAGDVSPRMAGDDVIPWAQGFTISVVDAASFP